MHRLLQFTLDLFERDRAPATPVPAPPQGARPRRSTGPRPPRRAATPSMPAAPEDDLFAAPTPDLGAGAATSRPPSPPRAPVATSPAVPLAEAVAPVAFQHPQANRTLRLQDSTVAYLFKRAQRRSIGFVVGPDGLVVSAPRWVTLVEVDAALQSKSAWILRKLGESRERLQRQAAAQVRWADGAELPYLGEPLRLTLSPGQSPGGQLQTLTPTEALAVGVSRRLLLGLPPQAAESQVRDAVQAWLMREAKALFTQRLDHFAPQLGVQWKKLALSNAGTRWGSARIDGSIRLNWRLIHFSLPVIDYVVVHELAHLRVMDHSPRFWDTVASVVPDHAQRRQQLRQVGLPEW
ncbi:SprT family zinc-dependent metalloprotease [Curvibacter sp. HBC61]|uniref:SprT family zinc-dependent metalloprotease n=1 Tax=Curvibacter cyanobacteriorum TaxID=3026422 RepID=A0ABT5MY54_9BURK|nr:SprT family zinc-dependent metalloprotease [Curvibacter sp. HBC61]MDD0838996.1 SprT family zinc-dependent metalloprotease [Curvibacter sp. HBC61]